MSSSLLNAEESSVKFENTTMGSRNEMSIMEPVIKKQVTKKTTTISPSKPRYKTARKSIKSQRHKEHSIKYTPEFLHLAGQITN